MARLAALVLLGTALGVSSAHPGHHGHLHNKQRHVEEKRADGDVIVATIDGQVVSWTMSGDYYGGSATTTSAAVAATTPATTFATLTASAFSAATITASATATGSASSGSGSGSGSGSSSSSGKGVTTYTPFEDACASSSSKRATNEQIAQVGNVGTADGGFGCNYLLVASEDVAEQYDNYVKFYGATEDMTCYYWNKYTSSGTLGGWYTSADSYKSFDLPAGETQYLAIQNGTGGAGTCQPASLAPVTDSNSGLLYTWVEWDVVDVTTAWSAFDVSSIQAQDAGGVVNGVEACTLDDTTCSSISAAAAAVVNAFDNTMKALDGKGYNTGSTLKFKVNLGFQ